MRLEFKQKRKSKSYLNF